jgi:hypothetical protein
VGKPEGKGPLERRRCRWEKNIKMDFINMMREYVLDACDSGWVEVAGLNLQEGPCCMDAVS